MSDEKRRLYFASIVSAQCDAMDRGRQAKSDMNHSVHRYFQRKFKKLEHKRKLCESKLSPAWVNAQHISCSEHADSIGNSAAANYWHLQSRSRVVSITPPEDTTFSTPLKL